MFYSLFLGSFVDIKAIFFSRNRRWVGRRRVGRGWVAAGGGDPPATHPDGNNGNNGNNGNGNNGSNENEFAGARFAPNQRAQGSHMPFGAPLSANHPHSDE